VHLLVKTVDIRKVFWRTFPFLRLSSTKRLRIYEMDKLAHIVSSLVKTMIQHGVPYKIGEFNDLMRDCELLNIDRLPWETHFT
jgi:hypothetical protein